MTPPRILYLAPGVFDKGGISRYSRYQISALRKIAGTANLRAMSLLGPDGRGFEDAFDVDWHGRGGTAHWPDRAAFTARALATTLRWRPDIIHAAHVNLSPLVTRLARASGAHSIMNVYGLELWSGLSTARADHLARIDTIIADCHSTADHVVQEHLHPNPPEVIWDCVDLHRYCPGPADPVALARYGLPNPQQVPLIVTLGRLSKAAAHKGYERLIEAFSTLKHPKARLVMAGQGDDVDRLRAFANARGLGARCIFTGPIDEADMPAIYRAARVFALVSDKGHGRGEGIPLTPLEAMACGAPVIVGDEDGSAEAVDGTRNGRVISPRDPGAFVTALRDLLAAPPDELRSEARAVAEARFGYDAFAEKHRALYAAIGAAR